MDSGFNDFSSKKDTAKLLQAALANISDGYTIWDNEQNLIAFNKHYEEMYFSKVRGLKVGMSLKEACILSIKNGNGNGLSAKDMYKKYSFILKRTAKLNGKQIFEREIDGQIIRSNFILVPSIGQIVTHKNVTAQIKQKEIEQRHEKQLIEKNSQFTTAINHMGHGLCLFSADKHLIICNEAYKEIYSLPDNLSNPGASFEDILKYRVKNGLISKDESSEEFFKKRIEVNADENGVQIFTETIKGRKLDVIRKKLPDGGWVSTQQDITEQRQKEILIKKHSDEVLQQNKRFNAAINNMSHGLALFDKDNNLVICNQPYIDIYQLPKQLSQPGTSFWALLDHDAQFDRVSIADKEQRFKIIHEVLKTDKPIAGPIKMLNGQIIYINHHPIDGGGWITIHEDITEKVEKEKLIEKRSKELLQQNMRFDAAVNNMNHGISMFDKNEKLIICNKPYANLYGLPKQLTKPGTSFWEIIKHSSKIGMNVTKDITQQKTLLKKIIKDGTPVKKPYDMINGKTIFIQHQPMPDGGWLSTHEDITEQRQKEEILKRRSDEILQQNMRFDAAVNNMTHGLAMFDKDHNLVICNQPYAHLYKLPNNLSKPGANFWDILDHGAKMDMVSIANKKQRFEVLNEVIDAKKPVTGPITMLNGQIIFINHQPLEDGGWLTTHEDITEQHKSEELIRYLARHDGLTDLPNRRSFHEMMEKNQESFASKNSTQKEFMAVLSIDLDRFKPINDDFGHGAGDEVIKEIGKRILLHVGASGFVARLGGDEFAALIGPTSGKETIKKIAANITNAILKPIKWDGIELNISASIGIALAPDDGQNTQDLMRNSDLALYYAKKQIGGSYCFFDGEMDVKRKKRQTIEKGLRQAIEKNELHLHYQPLVSTNNNKIVAAEALMRWESEEHNFSPFDFIPVAEETGLIREMGNWALQEACLTAAKWQNNERVAVNVSPLQFKNNDLVAQVADALIISGLDADRLELEITESLFLENNKHNLKILHDLKSLGVRIALDDFGTGYSSLSYLRSFPFDKIKIDRSFISSLDEKKENIAIIKAIIDLAKSMGMDTTAEGIETQEQLKAVSDQGCDQVQGYLFSPPLPKKAINKMLKAPIDLAKLKIA